MLCFLKERCLRFSLLFAQGVGFRPIVFERFERDEVEKASRGLSWFKAIFCREMFFFDFLGKKNIRMYCGGGTSVAP